MERAHVPLVAVTWRPVVLCGLLLASKVRGKNEQWEVGLVMSGCHYGVCEMDQPRLNPARHDTTTPHTVYVCKRRCGRT